MRASSRRIATLLLMSTVLTLPALALAQQQAPILPSLGRSVPGEEPSPNVAVQDRPRPEYDPIGLRAGSFFFYPEITVGGLYDDNVRAVDNDEEDDFALTVTPQIRAQSNFSRHQLSFELGADTAFYEEDQDLNYEDFYARGAGRLDITRDNILTGGAGVNRLHEDPSDPDAFGNDDLTEFWRHDLDLSYRRNFNRLFAVLGGTLSRFDFEDTNTRNEDDRDRNHYLGRLRLGYEISPRFNAFTQGSYEVRRYDETPDDSGRDRDSEGFNVRVGSEIDFTSILFGELAAGYTYRTYDDDELDTVNGFGFGGGLTWNVTPLTTIIFDGSGEIAETTVNFEGDEASADFRKAVSIDVTHELLRNILLNANIGYIRDDFEGTDRVDDTFLAGAGVSYLINRHLSLDGTYDFSTRSSDDDSAEFTRNIFRLGVTGKL